MTTNGQDAEGWRAPIPGAMHDTIIWTTITTGAVGVAGAFGAHADLPVIAAAWATMFVKLAAKSGNAMSRDTALKVATGVIVGVGTFATGVKVATTWIAYTGIGTVPAILANVSTNGALTYMVGRSAARVFLTEDSGENIERMIKAILRMFLPPRPHHP